MHPRLFSIGPFTIYSFGLMMALGFITASYVLSRETDRRNISADFTKALVKFLQMSAASFVVLFFLTYVMQFGYEQFFIEIGAGSYAHVLPLIAAAALYVLMPRLFAKKNSADTSTLVIMISLIAGLAGSKILYLIEGWNEFIRRPFSMLFDPGGLTWYGGFLLATLLIYFFTKSKGLPFLKLCDAAAPALMIGYGIARIGCHLAGDGDYGMPTNAPWAAIYSNGQYPPSVAFRDFPEIVQKYGINGVIPDSLPVHPTPVYEFFLSVLVFLILWQMRKSITIDGKLFTIYLMLSGLERFGIEFIRLNPRILFGLTEAQLIAAVLVMTGLIGLRSLPKPNPEEAAVQ